MIKSKSKTGYDAIGNEDDERNPFTNQQSTIHNEDLEADEDTPHNSGIMIHIVPDTKARWNHIEDLDLFFTRIYHYHQKHGFHAMMLQEVFELIQFIFVVFVAIILLHCIDYTVLFGKGDHPKPTIFEIFYSLVDSIDNFGTFTWIGIALSILFWIFRLFKVVFHIIQYWDIKKFYNTALKIEDNELENLTWHEVLKKIQEVQSELQMCIRKEKLSELDIYHRILRFKNYMVAMMNKNLLPAKIKLPILGEVVCLSKGLKYNIELILFRGPWSPFENNWSVRQEYKQKANRYELANKLSRQILYVGMANLVLFPLILLWQLMHSFFSYAELIKRDPSALGARCWSHYGQLHFRHFNELEHELQARLNRAYRPASKYMSSFSSPLHAVLAKNCVFMFGGLVAVITLLFIYDEDVMQVEHMITIATILTVIVVSARGFLPDENLIWCPEQLMTSVLAHVHYIPSTWKGLAHTTTVRELFGHFFQFRATYILIELFSPLVTPFVLLFILRPRALEIVDFYRQFTVNVISVGDICTFAQMDVCLHGNPEWQIQQTNVGGNSKNTNVDDTQKRHDRVPQNTQTNVNLSSEIEEPKCGRQGENGKTELSLIHFTLTNPEWKMEPEARNFIQSIKKQAFKDLESHKLNDVNAAMTESLYAIGGNIVGENSSYMQSIIQNQTVNQQMMGFSLFPLSQQGFMHPTSLSSRNPFSPTTSLPTELSSGQQQLLATGIAPPLHSTHLENIREDDNENFNDDMTNVFRLQRQNENYGTNQSMISPNFQSLPNYGNRNLNRSMRGSLSKCEGSISGSQDGLLYNIYGDNVHSESTVTDMSLTTLYLHKLHHRKMWQSQKPQQSSQHASIETQQYQQQPYSINTSAFNQFNVPTTSSASTSREAVEKTPLLKKS